MGENPHGTVRRVPQVLLREPVEADQVGGGARVVAAVGRLVPAVHVHPLEALDAPDHAPDQGVRHELLQEVVADGRQAHPAGRRRPAGGGRLQPRQKALRRAYLLTGADSAVERDRKRRRFQPDVGEPEADVFVLSDAGEAGLNLQRGQTLIQYDRPMMTAKTHAQRNGRIDRLGQRHPEIDLVDLATDTPYEARAAERIQQKYTLRNILTDPAEQLDDTGFAGAFTRARHQALAQRDRPPKVAT